MLIGVKIRTPLKFNINNPHRQRVIFRIEELMRLSLSAYRCLEVTPTSRSSLYMSRSRRWRKHTASRKEARALATQLKALNMEEKTDYSAWSHEKLIERVTQLEAALKSKTQRCSPSSHGRNMTDRK